MTQKARKSVHLKGWRAVGVVQAIKPTLKAVPKRQKSDANVLGPAWWVGLDRSSLHNEVKARFPKVQPSYGRRE